MWGESAFERIVKKDYPKTLLNVQYRSHEILYRPTSEIFYENAVRSDRVRPQLNGVLLHNGGFESEVAFLHYRGETILDDSHSIMNPGEAMLASQLAAELLGIGVRDVLIVSPYRAQVSDTANIWSASYPHSECKPRIQTVDSSQGSEADVVILSLTRARGPPGLLRSTKRTNVMTTRAHRLIPPVI